MLMTLKGRLISQKKTLLSKLCHFAIMVLISKEDPYHLSVAVDSFQKKSGSLHQLKDSKGILLRCMNNA
jgi:hypothetical protein